MHRRSFLAGALALPALRSAFSVTAPTFGCAAITWGGNDRAAIDDVAALGFRGIQLRASAVARWGERPGEVKELLASRNLAFVALSSGNVRLDPAAEADDLALHERNAKFVQDAGGTFLQVTDERPVGRTPTPEDFRRMSRLLTEIGKRAADRGVALAYHNHMGNLGQAPDEVARVLDAVDPRYVRLLLDVAHYQAAGGDPVDAVRRYRDHLSFLHLKDLQRPAPDGAADSYRFVELGRGAVNLPGVLAELGRAGYQGWAIVELDRVTDPARTPRECTQTSKDYLAKIGYHI